MRILEFLAVALCCFLLRRMGELSMKFSLSFCLWLLFCSQFALGCELKMRVYGFAPMAMQDEHKNWSGTDVSYGQAMATQLGCSLKLVEAPWARGLEMLRAGKIDYLVNVTKTAERAEWLYFVGPQRMEVVRIASIKGKLEPITSWQQMSKLDAVLMRQKGSEFGPRFDQLLIDNKPLNGKLLELVNNDIRFELLKRNRADGILVDEVYIDYHNQHTKDEKLEKHPLIIIKEPVYYAFSKAHTSEQQIAKIRAAFATLAKTKAFQRIGKQYR